MQGVLSFIVTSIKSLEIEKRLSPKRNPDIGWFYVFLPAFIGYIVFLTQVLNAKQPIGVVHVFNETSYSLLGYNAKVELIVNGSVSADGPLWIEDSSGFLIFSEKKANRISKWEEGKGLFTVGKTRLFDKSGCRKNASSYCEALIDPGSSAILNLMPTHYSNLAGNTPLEYLVCQYGDRSISIFHENGTRTVVVDSFKGRKLNSPTDFIWSPEGHLYFTDPPFGLLHHNHDKFLERELPFSGIYMIRVEVIRKVLQTGQKVDSDKDVRLLHKDMKRPYGIGFSPDYSKLYVSNTDHNDAYWKVFDVTESGGLANGKVFFNFTEKAISPSTETERALVKYEAAGNGTPRGLKVDIFGNLFASSSSGVTVFSSEGDILARIDVGSTVTNVAFGAHGALYITSFDFVAMLKTKTRPIRANI